LEEENMKKLLSLLGAVGLIATSSATVVSCGDPDKGTSNNDGHDTDDKTHDLSYFLNISPEDGVYDLGAATLKENDGAKNSIEGMDIDNNILAIIGYLIDLHAKEKENSVVYALKSAVTDAAKEKWGAKVYNTYASDLVFADGKEVTPDNFTVAYKGQNYDSGGNKLKPGSYTFKFTIKNVASLDL
jgi:hypothetical protein